VGKYGFRASFPAYSSGGNTWKHSESTCQLIAVNSPPTVAADNPSVTVNEGATASNTIEVDFNNPGFAYVTVHLDYGLKG